MNDYLEPLVNGSKQLNIELKDTEVRQFDTYLKQLQFFNKKFNLTAITEPSEIVTKHFLDSLSAFSTGHVTPGKSLLDIGAGAGFPGLALKIVLPGLNLTLVEANRKKSLFLDYMVGRLRLANVSVINLRAEEFAASSGRSQFDLAITRALSSLPVNLEYAVPALKIGGYYLAMKGSLAKEPSTENACKALNCKYVQTQKIEVPYLEAGRNIAIFQKIAETDSKYPRRTGVPAKNPL